MRPVSQVVENKPLLVLEKGGEKGGVQTAVGVRKKGGPLQVFEDEPQERRRKGETIRS